jgi:flagellar basal-body rod protein FlgC
MGLFDAIDVAGSALSAERLRMDVTAENLANAQTTRGADGEPYRRKAVLLQQQGGSGFGDALAGAMRPAGMTGMSGQAARRGGGPGGVEVAGIVEDGDEQRLVYDPGHPDADQRGYVAMPNVDPVAEMVDLISASRGYEANVTAMQTAKAMFTKTLELLR